jgi:putative transposase
MDLAVQSENYGDGKVAIERRKPPSGCVHHSDRGSQYAAQAYREILDAHGLIGSMVRLRC